MKQERPEVAYVHKFLSSGFICVKNICLWLPYKVIILILLNLSAIEIDQFSFLIYIKIRYSIMKKKHAGVGFFF